VALHCGCSAFMQTRDCCSLLLLFLPCLVRVSCSYSESLDFGSGSPLPVGPGSVTWKYGVTIPSIAPSVREMLCCFSGCSLHHVASCCCRCPPAVPACAQYLRLRLCWMRCVLS